MYGDKGVELIKEAVRAGDNLAPFNEDSVRYALGTTKISELNWIHLTGTGSVSPSLRDATVVFRVSATSNVGASTGLAVSLFGLFNNN